MYLASAWRQVFTFSCILPEAKGRAAGSPQASLPLQECLWQGEECAASLSRHAVCNTGTAADPAHQVRPSLDAAFIILIYPEWGPELLTWRDVEHFKAMSRSHKKNLQK